jgi:hypothetical protein
MLPLWFVTNSLFWQFSIEIGGLKLGLNTVILSLSGAIWIFLNTRVSGFSARVIFGLIIFLALSYLVAITGTCTDKFQKFVFTAPIFIILVCIGLEIGWRATLNDWRHLESVAKWILLIAIVGFIFEVLMPEFFPKQAAYRFQGKLSGLFNEPSHVAISLFPSIAILLVSRRVKFFRLGMLALFVLTLLSRSTSLIALICSWILYSLLIKRKAKLGSGLIYVFILSSIAILAALANFELVVEPILNRVSGVFSFASGEFGVNDTDGVLTEHISSIVYMQGWQDVWFNLQRTNGLGLGFNMMGCSPLPDVPARTILGSMFSLGELNAEDGSFLFAKMVSEVGVIGALMFFSIVWLIIQLHIKMGKNYYSELNDTMSMLAALIFVIFTSFFVRSTGYFGGGFLLIVVAVAGAVKLLRMYTISTSSSNHHN